MAEGRSHLRGGRHLGLAAVAVVLLGGACRSASRGPAPPAQAEVVGTSGPTPRANVQSRAAYLKGALALAREDGAEALLWFERAGRLDSAAAEPLLGQARSLELLGRISEARERVARSLQRDPACEACGALQERLAEEG